MSAAVTYKYKKFGDLYRPVIPVELQRGKTAHIVYALVDSGADSTIFNFEVAELIGIDDVTAGEKHPIEGFGGSVVDVFYHKILLGIPGKHNSTKVGFTKEVGKQYSGLLGQIGFFQFFSVRFDYPTKIVIRS